MRVRRLLAVIVGVVVLPGWLVLGVGSAAYGAGTLPEVPGVIEDGLYESPQFGFEVAWEEPWDFPPEPEIEPATSEPGMDVLNLSLAHPAEHDVYLSVGGIAIEDNDPDAPAAAMQELLDFWESDAYAETLPEDTVEILLSDIDDTSVAALMTWDDPASGTVVRLVQAVVSDDGSSFIQVNLRTTGVTFPASLPRVQDGIEVDGDSPFTVLDDRDILESVEDLGLDPGDDDGLIIDNDDDSDTTPDADDGDHDQDAADTYLDDVSDHYGDLDASVDRFFEILDSERITDADFADLEEILAGWHAAADTATSRNAPAALDDVQEAYLAYTQALGDAASAFEDFAAADPDSAEEDDALEAFGAAMSEAESAGADLEAALADAGV